MVKVRNAITDFLFETSEKLSLSVYTTQMAIVYLDRLMSRFDILSVSKQAKLWATALLLVACKFCEYDMSTPQIEDFRAVAGVKYSYASVVKCEKEICNKLQWDFMQVCPLTFTNAHKYYGMVFSDDKFLLENVSGLLLFGHEDGYLEPDLDISVTEKQHAFNFEQLIFISQIKERID